MPEHESSGWELDLTEPAAKLTFFETYYCWRIYHPDGIDADDYPEPIDGMDWGWDEDDAPGNRYLVGTPTNSCPVLTSFWQERGWLIEFHSQKERVALPTGGHILFSE